MAELLSFNDLREEENWLHIVYIKTTNSSKHLLREGKDADHKI